MSYHEVLHKLLEDGIVSITNHLFKILNKFLEHLSQNLQLNLLYRSQYFDGYCFVDWKHLLHSGCAIARQHTTSLLELSLLEESLGELHQV